MGFPQETNAHACWDFLYLGPRSFYCRVSPLVFWCFLRTWLSKGPWKAWSSNSDPSCSWISWIIFFVDHPCPTILPIALFGTCIVRTWSSLKLAQDDFATTFSGAPQRAHMAAMRIIQVGNSPWNHGESEQKHEKIQAFPEPLLVG